jgi:hypothetical protein
MTSRVGGASRSDDEPVSRFARWAWIGRARRARLGYIPTAEGRPPRSGPTAKRPLPSYFSMR